MEGKRTGALVLASASPRRRELLELLGVPFEVIEALGVDEEAMEGTALHIATTLAAQKAERVLARLLLERGGEATAWVVLGADTLVAARDQGREEVLGKPRDLDDARRMLRLLSGRTHQVTTAVAVARAGMRTVMDHETTEVAFKPLPGAAVERYLATRDHEGKAGAYGIQSLGRDLVAEIRGCYYNVVGLPVALVARMLDGLSTRTTCDCDRHPLQRGREGCRGTFPT